MCPPLNRFHNDNRFAVFNRDFIALTGLNTSTLPVKIIDLQLDKLKLRVFGQHLIQQFGVIMIRKANMF